MGDGAVVFLVGGQVVANSEKQEDILHEMLNQGLLLLWVVDRPFINVVAGHDLLEELQCRVTRNVPVTDSPEVVGGGDSVLFEGFGEELGPPRFLCLWIRSSEMTQIHNVEDGTRSIVTNDTQVINSAVLHERSVLAIKKLRLSFLLIEGDHGVASHVGFKFDCQGHFL